MKINGLVIKPGASLRGADLRDTKLSGADLQGANLQNANLQDADLFGANLRGADLRGANLQHANLRYINLRGAKLCRANLQGADLDGANLRCADLQHVSLHRANLQRASLQGAQLPDFQLHRRRHIIGWKKVYDDIILRLRIVGKRTATLTSNKCRASRVVVEAAFNMDEAPVEGNTFRSYQNNSFIYTVGREVSEPNYNPDPRVECTQGIHFFKTREEAADWHW